MIYQILMIVVELAIPMSCLDPHFKSLELLWGHIQIHNNRNRLDSVILSSLRISGYPLVQIIHNSF